MSEIILYDAELDGIPLEIEKTQDDFSVAVAQHLFPFKDGALLEGMGQNARTIKIKCHFYDEGYGNHKALINHLKDRELFELIHPIYGLVKGGITSVAVNHDDSQDAQVDFTFVENLRSELEVEIDEDVEAAAEDAVKAALDDAADELSEDILEELGPDAGDILDQLVEEGASIKDQVQSGIRAVNNYVKAVDGYVKQFESAMNDVMQPANSLISTVKFATSLPGRVIGTLAKVADRYISAFTLIVHAPDRFISNLTDGFNGLLALFPQGKKGSPEEAMRKAARVVFAMALNHQVALICKQDDAANSKLKQKEKAGIFDGSGGFSPMPLSLLVTVTTPATSATSGIPAILSLNQIETVMATSRTFTLEAVSAARSNGNVKLLAATLLRYVSQVKAEREKILVYFAENELPLHKICLINGLNYAYASRILSLNSIKNPNFVKGDVRVYAR